MLVVYKYEIAKGKENIIDLPRGAKVLTFGFRNEDGAVIWCLIDPDEVILERRLFFLALTGLRICFGFPPFEAYTEDSLQFIGTAVKNDLLMYHLFEIVDQNKSVE